MENRRRMRAWNMRPRSLPSYVALLVAAIIHVTLVASSTATRDAVLRQRAIVAAAATTTTSTIWPAAAAGWSGHATPCFAKQRRGRRRNVQWSNIPLSPSHFAPPRHESIRSHGCFKPSRPLFSPRLSTLSTTTLTSMLAAEAAESSPSLEEEGAMRLSSQSLDSSSSSVVDSIRDVNVSDRRMNITEATVADSDSTQKLLSYLPDQGRNLPPRIHELVVQLTLHYVNGGGGTSISASASTSATADTLPQLRRPLPTLEEISDIIEVEHRSRDVPVHVGNVVADVRSTGDELDEMCAKLLSLAALYRLPTAITMQLLNAPLSTATALLTYPYYPFHTTTTAPSTAASTVTGTTTVQSRWNEIRDAFGAVGWEGVSFPLGLAIRPQTKFRLTSSTTSIRDAGGRRARVSWWHRTRTLQSEAALAVSAAAATLAPTRQEPSTSRSTPNAERPFFRLDSRSNPRDFLKRMDAQWLLLQRGTSSTSKRGIIATSDVIVQSPPSTNTTNATTDDEMMLLNPTAVSARLGQLFFPHNLEGSKRLGLFRMVRRFCSQQYTALKRQGRAGFVAYCFFNCAFYSVGVLWQWRRIAATDPLTSSLSVSTLVARKFGKVFAYLYAFSQLCKVPKVCTAVGLAPVASRSLKALQDKLNVSETVATILLVSSMVIFWLILSSIPVVSEYATLKRIVRLDEQLMHVYGVQPV